MKLTSYRFCSRHPRERLERRRGGKARKSPHRAHFTTTSLLQRRGVIALITVGGGALGVVYFVHRLQTRERQTMRQAVYRDIEKLEKLKQAQNGAADK
jgi:hypothetical protein